MNDALERRRRWTLRVAMGGPLVTAVAWPLGMRLDQTHDTLAGALLLAGLVTLIATPVVLAQWRRYMARRLLDALVAGRTDLRHINGDRQAEATVALSGPACDLGAFAAAGLAEPFASAGVEHVLAGESEGIPFTLAELRLYNEEGFEVFAGVVGGFALQRACPGLTLVARERGLLGNLVASLGSGIERVGLEDPVFEGRFEVYGNDQVGSRTVLTTTMLERLVRLDDIAHARGFRCAFVGKRLMLALPGMHWRAPLWRVAFPLGTWLDAYRAWLGELIAMPSAVVHALALDTQVAAVLPQPPWFESSHAWVTGGSGTHVFQGKLARLVAGIGMPAVYIASGAMFGGLALFFGYYVFLVWGVAASGGWKVAWPIPLGVVYGIYAIAMGIGMLARLAWTWNAPLRSLRPPPQS